MPFLCSPIQNQDIKYAQENYSFLEDLFSAESGISSSRDEMPIDILVGLDYYYSILSGRTKRAVAGGPVALESNLGWILCGPINKLPYKNSCISNYYPSNEN